MKNMNMKERYWTINLQLFAGDGGDDDPGDEGGDDDNDDPVSARRFPWKSFRKMEAYMLNLVKDSRSLSVTTSRKSR